MHRRTFLAAGLGVLLHNTRAPGGDCPNLECRLPAVNPRPFPIAQAGRLERPAATIKRPLWSSLSILEKARAFSTLYKAYRTMASMAPSNPRSLAFQAWLHQYYCCKHPEGSSEIIPGAVRNIHSTSDFLPWHRAFLFFHERIIQSVSGDRNFRLPVWDWESPCGYQAPWAYDPGLLPTGMPCVCEARKEAVYQVNSSVLQGWLQSANDAEFMGQPAPQPPNTSTADPGCAYMGPHSNVHIVLNGYMRQVEVAAVDPVFYAHHANVDRYWEHWHNHYHFPDSWPSWSVYYFYDGFHRTKKPRLVKVTPAELLHPEELGYCYDRPSVAIPTQVIVAKRPDDRSPLFFAPDCLAELRKFLHLGNGTDDLIRLLERPGDQSIPARVSARVEPKAGRFYYLAIAGVGGDPIPIGGFGAFVDKHAPAARLCVPLSVDLKTLAQIWQAIQSRDGFLVLLALARDDSARMRPDPSGRGPIDGVWAAATGARFEFLLPDENRS